MEVRNKQGKNEGWERDRKERERREDSFAILF